MIDFNVSVAGFTGLTLSVDLAGLSFPEPENYVRAFSDNDGDGFFETPIFNFAGTGNLPYTETTSGVQLTASFQTFSFPVNSPVPGDTLRLRFELYNDTNSLNEASAIDNIRIDGIPEPTAGLLLLTGLLGFARRRRTV